MYTPEFFADPHPEYARLREAAAVHEVRNPGGLTYWLITRFAEAKAALADPRLAKDPRLVWDVVRDAGMVSGDPGDATFDLHTTDPPEHTRLRAAVGSAFTPGRVEALRPRIQAIADELVDGFGTEVELIGEYAYPLSLTVIAELLGVPIDDREQFREWTTAAMTPPYLPSAELSREEGGRLLREYVTEFVAGKEPADDLVSALLQTSLTQLEVITLTQQLLFAGHEPTTNLIGNGMATLLRQPDQLQRLRANPALLPAAIDELIRFDGPTARASPRFATTDVEIAGTKIPAGSVVIVGLAAANRDPRRFADPDQLDLGRPVGHLAFGHGIHRCLGVSLARLEGEIGIGTLLNRLTFTLTADLDWHPFPVFRGLKALPVVMESRK